jgi:hypothetical protein
MTMKAICSRPSLPTAYRTTLSDKEYLFRAPDESEEDTEALLDFREALVVGLGLLSTNLDYNFSHSGITSYPNLVSQLLPMLDERPWIWTNRVANWTGITWALINPIRRPTFAATCCTAPHRTF